MSKGKILVVEPDTDFQVWFQYHLTNEGYDLTIATDEQNVSEMIQQFTPNVVLMDVDIFNLDALERIIQPTETCRFVVMSKDDAKPQIKRFYEMRVEYYLTRPIYIDELLTGECKIKDAVGEIMQQVRQKVKPAF